MEVRKGHTSFVLGLSSNYLGKSLDKLSWAKKSQKNT